MRSAGSLMAGRMLPLALLALASAPAPAQSGPPPVQSQTARRAATIADHVAEASRRFGVPERWISAVMRAESNGDAGAVSSAGAMGLMQLMPDTWAYLTARYRLGNDPFNRRANILGGAAYLREMHDRFGAPGFLAAYNAGPSRYADYLARGRPLPAETRAYVAQLASVVGGPVMPQPAVAVLPDRTAWTRAALFPERPDERDSDDQPAADAPDMTQPAPSGVAQSAPRDTIFVALTGRPPR